MPTTVITDYALAEKVYTAKNFYVRESWRERRRAADEYLSKANYQDHVTLARAHWNHMDDSAKEMWAARSRAHLELQPMIRGLIIASLTKNPRRGWRGVEADIGYWCNHSTIEQFVTSLPTFAFYRERIIPLLSAEQKRKHFDFATLFLNNWGLGSGKFLLIHYDEKWFWGLVLRALAKSCPELGIFKHDYKTFHRLHINKVMGICFVACKFVDSLENGCEARRIDLIRAEAPRVADKKVGDRLRNDTYMVDCCITGSSHGTPTGPKCALTDIFRKYVFPWVDEAVGPGGWAEGHKVIIQGDQAGPHEDTEFRRVMAEELAKRVGWYWEPQAPQMPHANVLDLGMFPAMSKRHTDLARQWNGLGVLKEDEIWRSADAVFRQYEESKIAATFIHMSRLMKKVKKERGGNSFVGKEGSLSCDVRKDFYETEAGGMARKDGKTIPPPAPTST